MSAYLGLALPNLGLVAADTRVVFPFSPKEDGYRKIAPFPGGWIVGGVIGAALEHVGPRLVACTTPEAMHETLVAARPVFENVLARAPEDYRRAAAEGGGFFVAEPGSLTHINCANFELVRLGLTLCFTPPLGSTPADFADVVAAYSEQLRASFPDPWAPAELPAIRRLITHTAALYAEVYRRLGPDGNMSADVEIGVVTRSRSGELEWWHLPPAPADAPQPDSLRRVAPGELRFGPVTADLADGIGCAASISIPTVGGGVAAGPSAPPNTPSTTSVGTTVATANWLNGDTSPGVTTIIEYKRTADSIWIVAAEVDTSITTYQFTGLADNTQFHWRAKHRRNGQDSTYLGPVAGTTFTTIDQLAPPSGCEMVVIGDDIIITWDNGETGASTEVHFQGPQPGQPTSGTLPLIATKDPGVASHNVVDLAPGTYWAQVRHVKTGAVSSVYSNMASATIN